MKTRLMRGTAVLCSVLGTVVLSGCVVPPLATDGGYSGGYGGAPGYVYGNAPDYVQRNPPVYVQGNPALTGPPVVIDNGPAAYYYEPAPPVPVFGGVWIGGSGGRDHDRRDWNHDRRDWNHDDRREPPRMRIPGPPPRSDDRRNVRPPTGQPGPGHPGYGGSRHDRPGYGNGDRRGQPGHGAGTRGPGIAPARGTPPQARPPRAPRPPSPAIDQGLRSPDPYITPP